MKKTRAKSEKAPKLNNTGPGDILGRSEFLETVLESLTHPFYVIDARDYTIQMANSAARLGDITGASTCHALTHKKNKPCGTAEHPCPLEMVKGTKKPIVVEHTHYDTEGNARNVEVHGFPILDDDGNVVQMIEYCLDITDRKRTEKALQFERDKLTNILDSMEDGVYIASNQYEIQYINPALQREFGPPNGRKCYEYFYDRRDICPWCKSQDVFKGSTVQWEWHCPANDKTYDLLDTPIKNPDGSISKLEIFRDVTDRKRTEQALQESETRYRSFVQNFQGIVYQGRLNFVPVFFHGAVEKITGYKESEFVAGKPRWDQVIHKDDLAGISRIAEELRTVPGYSDEREYRIIRKDGQVRWVHELIQNVCDGSGKPNLVQGALYDITDRKRMEEDLKQHREHLEELVQARTVELTKANEQLQEEIARRKELEKDLITTNKQLQREIAERKQANQSLQQTQERFRDFFENAPVGFHIFGPDRKIIDINDAELKMIGYEKEEIVDKKTWADLILPEQRAEFEEHWRRMITAGQVRSLNYTLVHKDGHYVDVLLNASARFDENGRLVNTRGSVLNIDERRRLERELLNIVERERQRTGQELHDSIGQQLTGIALMIKVLSGKLTDKLLNEEVAYAEKAHKRIIQAAEKTRKLARGLHPVDLDRHSLTSALRELVRNTEELFGVSCSLEYKQAVSTKDDQATMNLYRIAQEAITNAIRHGKTKNIKIGLISEHGWLTMSVENDGLDFASERRDGEGMGLRIMRHRAEVINGLIDIRKRPEGGTIVTCVIPNRERS